MREYDHDRVRRDPAAPANEFRLLQVLHADGIPAPKPIYLGQSGEVGATPFLVLGYIDGTPPGDKIPRREVSRQLAGILARIHELDPSRRDLSFIPDLALSLGGPLPAGGSLNEGAIRDTIRAVWPARPSDGGVLLHGDFWPGNSVWLEDRLVGVIDWEDAANGDRLADVSNGRLEILCVAGVDAMMSFTDDYRDLAPPIDWDGLPVWDLWAAWRGAGFGGWGLDSETQRVWRERYSWFVDQAMARIGR